MPEAEVRHMRTPEVVEAVESGRIPVVPVATLETHDPHLPVEVDTRLAEEVVLRAARSRPDLLLAFPPVHYGYTEHTMDFPGGYSVRPQVLLELYYDIGESIAQNGFRKLVFVNGHGSNVNVMNLAARLVTLRTPALAAATSWWDLCRGSREELRESAFPGGMAHACEFETSAYLAVEPERVRPDLIEDCISTLNNEWTYSDTAGFWADPPRAVVEPDVRQRHRREPVARVGGEGRRVSRRRGREPDRVRRVVSRRGHSADRRSPPRAPALEPAPTVARWTTGAASAFPTASTPSGSRGCARRWRETASTRSF